MKIALPQNVKFLMDKLNSSGFESYIVGGCVRDSLLGITPHDWDIATNALPEQIISCFPEFSHIENGVKHGTVGVIVKGEVYEITTYRVDGDYSDCRHPESVEFSKSIENDLARRDFTINAMAYNESRGLIDLYGGEEDLKIKALRCVGDPDKRFSEDALRILRALRFASVYDFSIEINTATSILGNCKLLTNISEERVAAEFNRILCGNSAPYILNRFRNVFTVFIPEIRVMFGYDQNNPHHNKTLWKHTVSAVSHIEPDLILRLTMFFHDIGKPLACKYDEVKRLCHYKGHNRFSAAITEAVLKRLKYSNEIIDRVCLLIKYHDVRFSDSKKQIKHVMSAIGEERFSDLLKVQTADLLAQSMYMREEKQSKLNMAKITYAQILEENECFKLKDLEINGHDLIHLGVTEGKAIGCTLKTLLSMVIDGKIANDKEVLLAKSKEINSL